MTHLHHLLLCMYNLLGSIKERSTIKLAAQSCGLMDIVDRSAGAIQFYIKWFTFRLGQLSQDTIKQPQEKTAVHRKTLICFLYMNLRCK